jgi:protein involved in sex pheromone biosynthesis
MLNGSKGLLWFAHPFDVLKVHEIKDGFEQLTELMGEAEFASREVARMAIDMPLRSLYYE